MSDPVEGTFSKLMEIADAKPPKAEPTPAPPPPPAEEPATRKPEPPAEDINTTPYISQNYRFTEDELKWLRARSFDLSEQLGAKVPQNTILRIALRELRESCDRNPNSNPLTRAISRLKK